ncbi:MAG: SAM-dependent methyltransferase [Pseudanabaena sp.]|nr:MAG: SAM-dependent methyltransferase [Pseudanabaena sp.]
MYKLPKLLVCLALTVAIIISTTFVNINPSLANIGSTSIYQYKTPHSSDGIGKFYMGREIAQVMGHQGAGWLERYSRESEENPTRLIELLQLKPTDFVADIGAGTGYFSFRIAPLLTSGKVFAVDSQPEMIEILDILKQEKHIDNVTPILGNSTDPNLPESSIDLAIMVDAYHEFDYPQEMMQGIVKALKPNGRVILAEYRGENPFIAIKKLHKMTQNQVKKELNSVGLTWQQTYQDLPQQHLMVFQKQSI